MTIRRSLIRLSILLCGLGIGIPVFAARVGGMPPASPDVRTLSPFEQNLIDTQKAFIDAFERGDVNYVKSVVADDFMVIVPNGDIADREELIGAVHPRQSKDGPRAIFYDFKIVPLNDSAAVVTYNAVLPDNNPERYQHLSYTWVKQDGKWKLKFLQTTLNLWSAHDL